MHHGRVLKVEGKCWWLKGVAAGVQDDSGAGMQEHR